MSPRSTTNLGLSDLLRFLIDFQRSQTGHLPALSVMSKSLGISVATLREQLEVARVMGLVEVRPRTGIRTLPYSFRPAIRQSVDYAVMLQPDYFGKFSDLRNHIEAAYWFQAAGLLTQEDFHYLRTLIDHATLKLNGSPIQLPHIEHRELHLTIYRRLENPFVTGLLEAYWEVYEAVGMNLYTDLAYLQKVWHYHKQMVDALSDGNADLGYRILMEHMDLLQQRSLSSPSQKFE
jgi:DNA-binding FadR family transcriptional regulator